MLRLASLIFLSLSSLLAGCATSMPWESDSSEKKADAAPVYIFSTTIVNKYKESFQPVVTMVFVEKSDGGGKDTKTISFGLDKKGIYESKDAQGKDLPKKHLIRLELPTGNYTLKRVFARAEGFLIIGSFDLPLETEIQSTGNGVIYLGAINAVVRERKDNEFRAGSVVPLIDQAISGAAGGTYDIDITDQYEADVALFRKQFPGLGQQPVTKKILAPFDRRRFDDAPKK